MPFLILLDFIILLLVRFFVKIVITIFGWATNIFFGKLPDKNKVWFYVMMIISFVWMYCVAAKVFPAMLKIFIDYIPNKMFTQILRKLIYMLCLIAIPPSVGAIGAKIKGVSKDDKKRFIMWLLRGYRYTLILGAAMAVMLVFTPVIQAKRVIRHITAENMNMDVSGNGRMKVLDEIVTAMRGGGINTIKKIPSKVYSVPVKMVNGIIKELFDYTSYREMYVAGENISIYVNSSDIMLEGRKEVIEASRKAIVKGFVENDIFLTGNRESRRVEKEYITIYRNWKDGSVDSKSTLELLQKLIESSFKCDISYDEWALLLVQINVIQNIVLEKEAIL